MLPKYTAALIIIFFTLLGLVTFGIGLLPLVVLAPVLVRLIRVSRARSAESPSYSRPTRMQIFGTVIAAFALLVLLIASSVIAFVVVCVPIVVVGVVGPSRPGFEFFLSLTLLVLGVPAAAIVPYLIVLRLFKKDGGRKTGPRG
jgi:hypothetical protein